MVTAAAVIVAGLTPPAQGQGMVRSAAPMAVPAISWHPCVSLKGLQCAHYQVPLDYDNPEGPRISLFMSRRLADDQAHRIGSLFVNPGGPGGPAAQFVPFAAQLLGKAVEQRFDVIGIDPRGIGKSDRVVCRAQPGDPSLPPFPPEAFPRGPNQIAGWLGFDEALRNLCALRGNTILDHMSTADTARDMDLVRQAVGDDQLTYYGISYGTMLGSTYAAMFPTHVRAMILDGVLDPIQWTTGRFDLGHRILVSARLRSGAGAWDALTSSFNECDRSGIHRCPYAGRIATEWHKVITRLHAGAVRLQGQRVTYANVIGTILGGLYDASIYPEILRFIDQLYQRMFGHTAGAPKAAAEAWNRLRQQVAATGRVVPSYGPSLAAGAGATLPAAGIRHYSPTFEGVLCSDSVNPTDEQAAITSAHFANQQGPWFGAAWSWISSVCINWPGSGDDAFRGPWRTTTAHPLLITGNLHDPATPISGARAVNKLFKGSVLVTVNLWGHGALGSSKCVTSRWDRYLVTGRLPAPGLVCQPDVPLFPR
jgi:pimeloyl-ACP methyl ester carboxylesterase